MQDVDLIVVGVSISTLIVSLVQVIKSIFPKTIVKQNAHFIAILLGLIFAFLYNLDTHKFSIFETVVIGIYLGLQSSGIYSTGSTVLKNEKKELENELNQLYINQIKMIANSNKQNIEQVDIDDLIKKVKK